MTRLLGPDAGSRYSEREDGSPAVSATAVVWANSGATVLADIRAYDGSETPAGAIIGSQVAYDDRGFSELYWFPEGASRVYVSVDGGPVWPVDAENRRRVDVLAPYAGWHVDTFGAQGTGAADDAPPIQAAIDAAAAAGGGTVWFGAGTYLCASTLVIPTQVQIRLVGVGQALTSIRRNDGLGAPVLSAPGTTLDRIDRLEICDLQFHGNGGPGTLVSIASPGAVILRNVWFFGSSGTLLAADQWWNCWLDKVVFNNGGTGTATPATKFTGDCNTVNFTDCVWEGNGGTDLEINDGMAFEIVNPKLERDFGAYPLVQLNSTGSILFTNAFMNLGPTATLPHIVQTGSVVPDRPNQISNSVISGSRWTEGAIEGDFAPVNYFVDVGGSGQMLLSNVAMNGNPTTAYVHVGSSAEVRASTVRVTNPAKLWHDERPSSVYGFGSVPLIPAKLDANVVLDDANNRVVWRFPDAVVGRVTYANVPVPSDAAANRPLRVRVLWYSNATSGAVQFLIAVRPLGLSNDDVTTGLPTTTTTVTVPGTANRTISTTVSVAANVTPAAPFVAVLLQRHGTDAADTCTGNMYVLSAQLLYERAV